MRRKSDWIGNTVRLVGSSRPSWSGCPTVPRLFDAWLRVAFLPQWIEQSLDDIRQDRSSGAAELAREALALLAAAAEQLETSSPRELSDSLDRAAGALRLVRPTMAPIGYSANQFETNLVGIEGEQALSLPELRSADCNVAARNLRHRGGPTESSPRGRCRRLLDGRRCSRDRQLQLFPGRRFQAGRRARKTNPSIGARVRRRSALVWRSESPMPRVRPAWTPFSCRTMSCRRQCDRRTWRSSAPILYCRTVRS